MARTQDRKKNSLIIPRTGKEDDEEKKREEKKKKKENKEKKREGEREKRRPNPIPRALLRRPIILTSLSVLATPTHSPPSARGEAAQTFQLSIKLNAHCAVINIALISRLNQSSEFRLNLFFSFTLPGVVTNVGNSIWHDHEEELMGKREGTWMGREVIGR